MRGRLIATVACVAALSGCSYRDVVRTIERPLGRYPIAVAAKVENVPASSVGCGFFDVRTFTPFVADECSPDERTVGHEQAHGIDFFIGFDLGFGDPFREKEADCLMELELQAETGQWVPGFYWTCPTWAQQKALATLHAHNITLP